MPTPIRFHFDFISPYAYVAWRQIHEIATRHGRAVELVPVLFAALLDANATKGPAEIPSKRRYTFKDAYRKAVKAGIGGLVPPPSHPFNPLLALRAASLPGIDRNALVMALYDAAWKEGRAIDSASAVAEIASAAGLHGESIVRAAQEQEAKDRLRAQTSAAIHDGVFGVPTMIVEEELFFGTESLEYMEAFLRGEDPLPKDLAWAERPASTMRKAAR